MAASRTSLLLALSSTTALVAWQPAWAACTSTATADTYSCAAGTTVTGSGTAPLFDYAGAGSLSVVQGALLDGAGQSVVRSGWDPTALLRVTNAGDLQGINTVNAGGRLDLTNSASGLISSTGTAVKWLRYGVVVNDGTIQGHIDGNEGEVTNRGIITGTTQMIYGAVANSGTMGAILTSGQINLYNTGTVTGDVRKSGGTGYVSVNNSGTLASALELSGQGLVDNSGTIGGAVTLSGTVSLGNSGTIAGPVSMAFNGYSGTEQTIVNLGTLQSTLTAQGNTSLDNQGTIAGAVALESGATRHTVTNSGQMQGGLRMSAAGTLTNASTGTIANGVNLDGQNLAYTVTNNGAISGGLVSQSNLTLTNGATGTLSGSGNALQWYRFATVVNNGTIQGNIDGNEGELTNRGTITGATNVIYTAISNYGTMNALTAHGQLNLYNTGTISGDVRKGGAGYVTVINSGTLASTVDLSGQGQVDNSGTMAGAVTLSGAMNLDNGGTIAGPVTMDFNGYSGTEQTVLNRGTLQSTLTARGNTAVDNRGTMAGGMYLESTTAAYRVTNSGTVNTGVVSLGNLTLTNTATGSISGGNAIGFNSSGRIINDGAIQGNILGNEGEVTNNGTLTGNIDLIHGTITNTGIITGAARGWANNIVSNSHTGTITGEVRVDGNGGSDLGITNAGRMESTVRATGKGTLTNSGTIAGPVITGGAVNLDNSGTIGGAVQMEINSNGGSAREQTITNRGTLQSTLTARGDTTLDNLGTIVGAVTLDSGANRTTVTNSGEMRAGLSAANAATVDNSGTIQGPVQLSAYDDTMIVRQGAVFGGTVTAGGGIDTLQLAGPGSGAQNLSRFLDFERTEVLGGDWNLGGSIASLLSVNGGTVRGTGTFGGITALNGTLAPGANGSGILTANGNVSLGSGSVLHLEVNGASNSMLRATGTVSLGGTLSVATLNGMRKGQYVLIDAAGLSGDFDHVLLPTGPWRQSLARDGGQLVLDVDVVALQSSTGGGGVVSTLEGLRGGGGSAEITRIIDTVSMMPAAEQSRAVASMTPERQAGTPTVMANQVNFFQGAVQNRVAQVGGSPRGGGSAPIQLALAGTHLEGLDGTTLYAGQSRWSEAAATGAWVAPWGGVARQKEGGGATGWNSSSGGIAIGADTSLGKDLVGGVAAGWGRTDVTYGGVGGDSGNDVLVGSLYGAWTPSQWTVDAGLTVALSRFDTTRKVLAGTETRTARSDYAGRTVAASLGGKRRFETGDLEISPDARLTATRWWLDGYDENGAGALNLQVDGRSGNRLRAETGVELATSIATESGRVRPWLRLAAGHDWTTGSRALQARFTGTAAGFAVDGKDDAGLRWLPGAGLSLDLSESVEASLEYQAELRHDFQAHTGQVALRYRF